MVVIRLSRGGAKKQPFYHIVAADRRNRRDGRYIEQLGYFNPQARGEAVRISIDLQRVEYWQSKGAQLSERAEKILAEFKAGPEKRETALAKKQAAKDAKKKAAEAALKAEVEAKAKAEAQAKAEKTEDAPSSDDSA